MRKVIGETNGALKKRLQCALGLLLCAGVAATLVAQAPVVWAAETTGSTPAADQPAASNKDQYDPKLISDTKVKQNSNQANAGVFIENWRELPEETQYKFYDEQGTTMLDNLDTSKPGEFPLNIKVIYPDSSSEFVKGKYTVVEFKPLTEHPKVESLVEGDTVIKVAVPSDARVDQVSIQIDREGNKQEHALASKMNDGSWKGSGDTKVALNGKLLEFTLAAPLTLDSGVYVWYESSKDNDLQTQTNPVIEPNEETKAGYLKKTTPMAEVVRPITAGDNHVDVKLYGNADGLTLELADGTKIKILQERDDDGNYTYKTEDGKPVVHDGDFLIIPVDSEKLVGGDIVKVHYSFTNPDTDADEVNVYEVPIEVALDPAPAAPAAPATAAAAEAIPHTSDMVMGIVACVCGGALVLGCAGLSWRKSKQN